MKTDFMKFKSGQRKASRSKDGAFTLIELLVVIAIMAILAAFTLSVLYGVGKLKVVNTATAELEQIQTALDDYKTQYGSYPPANPLNYKLNPLYYELLGVTNVNGQFETLDSASTVPVATYNTTFGVGGAINCGKPGNDAEAAKARSFLTGLKPNRIGQYPVGNSSVGLLVTSAPAQDSAYQPLGVVGLNPFCYAYPGTNNPTGFDLWIDLKINGKTNRVCNWRKGAFVL
jgi:prepilin-type N-terminal cleavage/methylation domain-containing protein